MQCYRVSWSSGRARFIALALSLAALAPTTVYAQDDTVDGSRELPIPGAVDPELPADVRERLESVLTQEDCRADLTLDCLLRVLRGLDGPNAPFEGRAYGLSRGNALVGAPAAPNACGRPGESPAWLIQTPNAWGCRGVDVPVIGACDAGDGGLETLPACPSGACAEGTCVTLRALKAAPGDPDRQVCVGHSDRRLDVIYDALVAAESRVDITSLDEISGRFEHTLRNALGVLARKSAGTQRVIFVRILLGHSFGNTGTIRQFFNGLRAVVAAVPRTKLQLQVGKGRVSLPLPTWNHAKIIAVDGQRLLTGGHNLWSGDYLLCAPVHDLSTLVEGPIAGVAHNFSESLWERWCKDGALSGELHAWADGNETTECLTPPALGEPQPRGTQAALAVGNYGRLGASRNGGPAYLSNALRVAALRSARSRIVISQQEIGMGLAGVRFWPQETLDALADALERNVDVFIVQTQGGATTGAGGRYYWGVGRYAVADELRRRLLARLRNPGVTDARLCAKLHLASIRFSAESIWFQRGGALRRYIANHAKTWAVDDKLFYVGSDNIYPAALQEFGIVFDGAAVKDYLASYWTPLWQYSVANAISGSGTDRCYFREASCPRSTQSGLDLGWAGTRRAVDVDGDGRADFCRIVGWGLAQSGRAQIKCSLAGNDSQASQFLEDPFRADDLYVGSDNEDRFRFHGDVNGDGKSDFCRRVDGRLSCALSDGKTFKDGAFRSAPDLDFGADWFPRALVSTRNPAAGAPRYLDFCRFLPDGAKLACALGGPNGFAGEVSTELPVNGNSPMRFWADADRDGRTDFCRGWRSRSGQVGFGCAYARDGRFEDVVFGNEFAEGAADLPQAMVNVDANPLLDYCRLIRAGGGARVSCLLNPDKAGFHGTRESEVLNPGESGPGGWLGWFIDVNHDGRSDYCRAVGGQGQRKLWCALATDAGFIDVQYFERTIDMDGARDNPPVFATVDPGNWPALCRVTGGVYACERLSCGHRP